MVVGYTLKQFSDGLKELKAGCGADEWPPSRVVIEVIAAPLEAADVESIPRKLRIDGDLGDGRTLDSKVIHLVEDTADVPDRTLPWEDLEKLVVGKRSEKTLEFYLGEDFLGVTTVLNEFEYDPDPEERELTLFLEQVPAEDLWL